MKRQIIQDERVLAQKRKIGSDAFALLYFMLLVSVLIQQYVFNAPFSQYAVEVICFLTASAYALIRNLVVGNDIFSSKKNSKYLVIVNSLVCGFTVAVINTALNYARYKESFQSNIPNTILITGITFLSATAFAFFAFGLLYLANKKKQRLIEESLNNDENANE